MAGIRRIPCYFPCWQGIGTCSNPAESGLLAAIAVTASDKPLVFLTRRDIEANNRFDFIEFSAFGSPNCEFGAAPPFWIKRAANARAPFTPP